MMDVMQRVRELLGGNKSKKRKSSATEEDSSSFSSIIKKFRAATTYSNNDRLSYNLISDKKHQKAEQMNTNRCNSAIASQNQKMGIFFSQQQQQQQQEKEHEQEQLRQQEQQEQLRHQEQQEELQQQQYQRRTQREYQAGYTSPQNHNNHIESINDTNNIIVNYIENDYLDDEKPEEIQRPPNLPLLQRLPTPAASHKTQMNGNLSQRQIPGLIKPNSLRTHLQNHKSFETASTSLYGMPGQPQQTIRPHYGRHPQKHRSERDQFTNIPQLYPINKSKLSTVNQYGADASLFNGSYKPSSSFRNTSAPNATTSNFLRSNHKINHQQPAFNNLLSAKTYYGSNGSSMSLKNNIDAIMRENNISNRKNTPVELEKKSYSQLLSLIPFYNKSLPKVSHAPNFIQKPLDIIDLANENDADDSKASIKSNLSNISCIEPVNTLRTRLETKPVFKENWVNDLNQQYSDLTLSRTESRKVEEEKTTVAEKKTREHESTYFDNYTKFKIDDAFVYDVLDEEEEVVNDFPELDGEKQQQIMRWMAGRDSGTTLITKFSLSITRHDIQTLNWNPLTWLNDEVINFYMELLGERSRQNDSMPKVYGMNTFFLKRLLEVGYSGVRRWTRKVDIFSYDIIPIPVHKGIHWCMAIIHMKNKTIKYYDSMGAPNNVVLNALTEYLQAESLDKKKCDLDISDWSRENVKGIPQQENGSDCGVFSCMYAEFITRGRPICFSQQHMPYFRMKMVYEICTGQLLV